MYCVLPKHHQFYVVPKGLREIKMATVNLSTIRKHLVFGLTKSN